MYPQLSLCICPNFFLFAFISSCFVHQPCCEHLFHQLAACFSKSCVVFQPWVMKDEVISSKGPKSLEMDCFQWNSWVFRSLCIFPEFLSVNLQKTVQHSLKNIMFFIQLFRNAFFYYGKPLILGIHHWQSPSVLPSHPELSVFVASAGPFPVASASFLGLDAPSGTAEGKVGTVEPLPSWGSTWLRLGAGHTATHTLRRWQKSSTLGERPKNEQTGLCWDVYPPTFGSNHG